MAKETKKDEELKKDFAKVCKIWSDMDMAMRKAVAAHGGKAGLHVKVLAKEIADMTALQQAAVIDALHKTALKTENKKVTKGAKKMLNGNVEKRFEVACIMDDDSEMSVEWTDKKAEATKIRKRILQSGHTPKGHNKPLMFSATKVVIIDHALPDNTSNKKPRAKKATKKTAEKAKATKRGGNEVTVAGEKFTSIRSAIMHLMKSKGVDNVTNEECEKIAKEVNPDTAWQKTHYYYYRKIVKVEA